MTRSPRALRFAVAAATCGTAAAAGLSLQSLFGYRFPLITFYPAIMLTAWYGGFWPGVAGSALSAILVTWLWLAPLQLAQASTWGDVVALGLFVAIGLAISGFSGSLHRSVAREHAARRRAEDSETSLQESEHGLSVALAAEQKARLEAENANRLKDQVLAIVSHELRTPLNAVLGWADMLKTNTVEDGMRAKAIESIHANAKRQAQIVDDLLDVARIMQGKVQLDLADVDVGSVVGSALDVVQPLADVKHIAIVADVATSLPTLRADAMRLQQIVWNLLANAVKFTPPHGVVTLTVRHVSDAVEVVIRDTGRGIAPEMLQRIFEPFWQADNSRTRVHDGLGLGLSIVRYLVDAHGGSVNVESDGEGRGATVTVRFPITPSVASPLVPFDAAAAMSTL